MSQLYSGSRQLPHYCSTLTESEAAPSRGGCTSAQPLEKQQQFVATKLIKKLATFDQISLCTPPEAHRASTQSRYSLAYHTHQSTHHYTALL